jgi:hypothetical protein
MATGIATGNQASTAQKVHSATAMVQAEVIGTADATRWVHPTTTASSGATSYAPKALVKHAAFGAGDAEVISASVAAKRTAYTNAAGTATAALASALEYGAQQRANAQAVCDSSAISDALQAFAGGAIAEATAVAYMPIYGRQHYLSATSDGISTSWMPGALIKYAGGAVATADAVLLGSTYGTQHWGGVSETTGTASIVQITPVQQKTTSAIGTGSAFVGSAIGFANSDVLAPDDRYMTVPAEERAMTVYAEERTMVVTV